MEFGGELKRKTIEAFQKAYKADYGEDIDFATAHEMAHRLVGIFLTLEQADIKKNAQEQGIEPPSKDVDDLEQSSNPVRG